MLRAEDAIVVNPRFHLERVGARRGGARSFREGWFESAGDWRWRWMGRTGNVKSALQGQAFRARVTVPLRFPRAR